ncbi:MAG: hypothetical protein EPO32_14660 [Anaerolineae bacterium]|nr:MAG: hypothetical protein EPO32_14660 [Anaerolineae bacterium]
MKHRFDPRTQVGIEQALWHADPILERFVRTTIEQVKPARFVETGTHMGWTSLWVADNYPDLPVYTVETDKDFYERSGENLSGHRNVHRTLGDSRRFLRDLVPTMADGVTLLWLDAHWYPPVPLREECAIVKTLGQYVCLLDDFQCYAPDFNGDTFYSRFSKDYTKTGPEGGGDAYKNDLSYVVSELGDRGHFRPNYTPKPGNNGVGCWVKGIDWTPPEWAMKAENWAEFVRNRPPGAYPMHPSSVVWAA